MVQDETTFPMDVTEEDPSSRPWNFKPEGYLVVIITDTEQARRAKTTLARAGVAPGDIKLYSGNQILENQAVYLGRRSVMTKLIAAVTEDVEGRELYLSYAREDRCAMWVRLPDEGRVACVLRLLGDFGCLHMRYYGHDEQHDFHIALRMRNRSHRVSVQESRAARPVSRVADGEIGSLTRSFLVGAEGLEPPTFAL